MQHCCRTWSSQSWLRPSSSYVKVYVDFMSEVDRAKEEYGVLMNDRIDDKFANQYNAMSTLISNTLAKIMDYEVNEAIKD